MEISFRPKVVFWLDTTASIGQIETAFQPIEAVFKSEARSLIKSASRVSFVRFEYRLKVSRLIDGNIEVYPKLVITLEITGSRTRRSAIAALDRLMGVLETEVRSRVAASPNTSIVLYRKNLSTGRVETDG